MSPLPLALAGLMLAATPAAADVTPRQAWDAWLASLDERDATVSTGAVEESATGIVVTDLSITTAPDADDGYSLQIDEVALSQAGDGTVGVSVSPEYRIVLSGTDEDGVAREMHLLVQHPRLEMTVADAVGNLQHSFAAPEIRVTLERVLAAGAPVDAEGGIVFEDASGQYDAGGSQGPSAFSAASISFEMGGSDPDTGERYDTKIGAEGFAIANLLQIVGKDTAAIARQLAPGASLDGTFSTQSATFSLVSGSDAETSSISGSVGPGETMLSVSAQGLEYSSETRNLSLAFAGSAVPMPQLTLGAGSTSLALTVPILASEEPQPYALGVSLLDVALDDGLWNMVDPAGILPREPGEVTIDIAGDIAVEEDVDARAMADDASDELRSLNINAARIAFADAEIGASGDLTVEQSPLGTPLLVGEIGITLTGGMQLLDKLVQAGIVPEEQAMGTRMMLGMFAQPGATEEELVSRIRLTEDGRVFVNDQQVR